MEAKVKFAEYDRAEVVNGSRSIEQVLTEAILHIQRNTIHTVVHSEVTHNSKEEDSWMKKNRKLFNDVTLKVIVRIPINEE